MLDRLQDFAALLRANRVRVSTGEVLDAARATAAVGLDDPEGLRAALAATLVKRAADRAVFDELFALYFLRAAAHARSLAGAALSGRLAAAGLDAATIDAVLAAVAEAAAGLSPAGRAGLGVGGLDLPALLRAAGVSLSGVRLSSPLQVGYYTHRVLADLDVDGAERDLEAVAVRVAADAGEAAAAALRAATAQNLAELRAAVRRQVQERFERENVDYVQEFRARTLAERPFSLLSDDDLARLRHEVRRLAAKLRARAALRREKRRRARLDVRRTLRAALATGGVPFAVRHRRRKPVRPRLVVLCDVSDSVRNVSRFMLELVYALGEQFEHVRSFVFVADLGETTALFRQHDLERAVRLAYEGAVVNVAANSDYGRALGQFAERHLDAVTARTTVIVIGDARTNYAPPRVEALAELRRRAKRLWWLNPEPPGAWALGDGVMRLYEPVCDRVVVAQHLGHLRKVVDQLLL